MKPEAKTQFHAGGSICLMLNSSMLLGFGISQVHQQVVLL